MAGEQWCTTVTIWCHRILGEKPQYGISIDWPEASRLGRMWDERNWMSRSGVRRAAKRLQDMLLGSSVRVLDDESMDVPERRHGG